MVVVVDSSLPGVSGFSGVGVVVVVGVGSAVVVVVVVGSSVVVV